MSADKDIIPVTVRILEKEYKISCPQGEHESLLESARYVDDNMKKIRESSKALGADRVAVMAAINIAHELIMANNEPKVDESITTRLDTLQQSIDSIIQ